MEAYRNDPEFKATIDSIDSAKADFDDGWNSINRGQYNHLHEFLGGLAPIFSCWNIDC
jgi:hypothetical protein